VEVRRVVELFRNRPIFSWALYDWANSVFATTVMAGFFPVFFKEYWSAGSDAVVSTAQLGFSNSIASVFILVAAPILGAIADGGGARKKYLGVFTALGIVMSAGLWFVAQGDWAMAALVYVLAVVGFSVNKYMNMVEDGSHVGLYCRSQFVHPLLGTLTQMFRLILDSVPFAREGIATMLQFPARGADQILGAEVLLNFARQTKCSHELVFLDFRKKTDKWA